MILLGFIVIFGGGCAEKRNGGVWCLGEGGLEEGTFRKPTVVGTASRG